MAGAGTVGRPPVVSPDLQDEGEFSCGHDATRTSRFSAASQPADEGLVHRRRRSSLTGPLTPPRVARHSSTHHGLRRPHDLGGVGNGRVHSLLRLPGRLLGRIEASWRCRPTGPRARFRVTTARRPALRAIPRASAEITRAPRSEATLSNCKRRRGPPSRPMCRSAQTREAILPYRVETLRTYSSTSSRYRLAVSGVTEAPV